MSIYKVVLRDGANPDTSSLHVIERFCYADTRNQARDLFDAMEGGIKYHVAGPLKVEESAVPAGAVFINGPN